MHRGSPPARELPGQGHPSALAGRITAIAYGAGSSFAQSVASLIELGPDRPVLYIGDLDAEGIAIPQRAAVAAAAAGVKVPTPS